MNTIHFSHFDWTDAEIMDVIRASDFVLLSLHDYSHSQCPGSKVIE